MAISSQYKAAHVLQCFGTIAHQTDTVYGLACLPYDQSLLRLSRIKHRPSNKKFILLASSIEQVRQYIVLDEKSVNTLNTATDTPTTWLVPATGNISKQLVGDTNKVAIRLTNFKPIQELCFQVGAIASTSANISNQKICTNAQQIRYMFGPNIDYIDPSHTPGTGKSSTIIDLSSGQVIRR